MRHIDLFSGIGGFSLAAQWVWGDEHEIACFVEIDKFCQRVLAKHWPDVPIVEDVNDLERIIAYAKRPERREKAEGRNDPNRNDPRREEAPSRASQRDPGRIDLLTGGFPCQPFSCAGKRQGDQDNRYLWPAMLAAIRATAPRWVVAENVPGLLSLDGGLVFERVCLDLEDAGYEVWPFVLPACGQNAPHRRDRVWIVAHSDLSQRRREGPPRWNGGASLDGCVTLHFEVNSERSGFCQDESGRERRQRLGDADCDATDTNRFNGHNGGYDPGEISQQQTPGLQGLHAPHPHRPRPQEREMQPRDGGKECATAIGNPWDEHWYAAATRLCRVDDGLPGRMDEAGGVSAKPKDKKAAGRVHRLRALGNAIVPQVAAQIFRAIKEVGA